MKPLTHDIKSRAVELGFDLVGVAPAGEAAGTATLRRWLDQGLHGEMAYMARHARLREHPEHLLEGCRSVIMVAMSYRSSHLPSWERRQHEAWISRYAWGRDYHKILKKKLVQLGRWLAGQRPDSRWRSCVDTAPLPERAWAAAAGLGWIGKNSQLISRRLGSELFLGALLTTVALESDSPTTDHCGRCTACLDACPTEAFLEPGLLDARRCIAYLTIEHRGAIRVELAGKMGTMVAGCDICQEVCPWNRKAPVDLHEEFQPAPDRHQPPLHELEALDEAGFHEWRRGSALNRISYEMFRRNLAIARCNASSNDTSKTTARITKTARGPRSAGG